MNELIKIEKSNVGGDLIETVNARELHQFLEVGKDFSNWIKNRIEQYGFVEGVDYLINKFIDNPLGGRPVIDYHNNIVLLADVMPSAPECVNAAIEKAKKALMPKVV